MGFLPGPQVRANQIGREELEAQLGPMIAAGALTHGWMITGGEGAGKATLAYRIARALLDPGAFASANTLDMAADARIFRLAAQGAHPDLFVAERRIDPKTERRETEISVDTIRELIAFMGRTAAFGGWRVAIVDTADDLNRNSANALLKVLEEPPARATLLLLASSPGRLLATIRSRCRRIDLRAVPADAIAALVEAEAGSPPAEAHRIAAASAGRPGFALTLATGEGGEAIAAVETFLLSAMKDGDVGASVPALTGKAGDARWEIFRQLTVDRIARAARDAAAGGAAGQPFSDASPSALGDAYHQIAGLFGQGEALNADRGQLVMAAGRLLRRAVSGRT